VRVASNAVNDHEAGAEPTNRKIALVPSFRFRFPGLDHVGGVQEHVDGVVLGVYAGGVSLIDGYSRCVKVPVTMASPRGMASGWALQARTSTIHSTSRFSASGDRRHEDHALLLPLVPFAPALAVGRADTLPPVLTERNDQDGDHSASGAGHSGVDRVALVVDSAVVDGDYAVVELGSVFECFLPSGLPVGYPFIGICSKSFTSFSAEVSMHPCW
jgi:hypothetical protein